MASSAGSIALALEGRATMVTASAVRTYRPTPVSRAASGANGSSARPSSGVDVGNRAKKTCPRSRQRMHHTVERSHCREETARAPGGMRCGAEKVRVQERARARCRSGASLLRAAFEQGATRGAEVAAVMGHACPDPINVRDVLLAEPHRIRFAGRALLRGPLLRRCGRRREHERKAQERGRERGGGHRPELRLCDTNFHYRPSSWCSAPVSTVNPTGMASSHAAGQRLGDRGCRVTQKLNTDG